MISGSTIVPKFEDYGHAVSFESLTRVCDAVHDLRAESIEGSFEKNSSNMKRTMFLSGLGLLPRICSQDLKASLSRLHWYRSSCN